MRAAHAAGLLLSNACAPFRKEYAQRSKARGWWLWRMPEVFPLYVHRKCKNRPFIEFRNSFASLIGRKVRIAEGHPD